MRGGMINTARIVGQLGQLSLASLPSRLIEYQLRPGKGGNIISAGWQVTLCDPMWHVSSRSGVATLRTAIHLLLVTYAPRSPVQRRSVSSVQFIASAIRHGTGSHFDPGIQRSGDPVDPVTLFYNELQMSTTYVWRSILRPKNF